MAYTTAYAHSGNAPDTTLASGISNVDTTLSLASGTGFPSPTGGQLAWLVIAPGTAAEEKVTYTGRSGASITGVARGQDGTSATSHASGVTVRHIFAATEADEANYAVTETVGKITAANQLLVSDASQSLAALDVAASRFVGRKASGNVAAMTVAEALTLLGLDAATLAELIRDTIGTALVAGTFITITPNDGGDTITIAASAPGFDNHWMGAGDLESTDGSPTRDGLLAAVGGQYWVAWQLDAASQEGVSGTFLVPSGWATVDIDLWWTNAGAGAGNVVFAPRGNNFGDGETMSADATAAVTVAAPALAVLKKSTLVTAKAVTAGELFNFSLIRDATNGSDTLANDCAVLGINVRKAS